MFGWIFKGKMEVKLSSLQFNAGDMIQGTLVYSVKKNQTATKTSVRLFADERRTSGMGQNRQVRHFTVFDFELPLKQGEELIAGQKYEVPFEIGIPQNLPTNAQGPQNDVAKTFIRAASLLSNSRSTVKWYVKGRVDLPGFDVMKKVQINVI